MDYQSYHNYLDEELPPESPYLYGLHPNAEIGFLTMTSEHLFRTVLEMQPRDGAGGGAAGMTKEEKVCLRVLLFDLLQAILLGKILKNDLNDLLLNHKCLIIHKTCVNT